MKDNRCELNKGGKITVSGKDYIVDSVIGCGASCICYKAYEKEPPMSDSNREIKVWMAIKEFYPLNIAIRNSSMKVIPASDDIKEWKKAQIRWREGIDKGREFQAKDGNDFMEIEAIDASYSVMRLRRGKTLEEWVRENVSKAQGDNSDDEYGRTKYVVKCLDILRDLCACIEKYQDAGIIHLDVKPENIYILDDNNNKRIVRLIDYDSLMNKDEFYKIASGDGKISMYSIKEYYGEEVWSQRSDWKAAAKDENVWKQVDVYALGKVLQYMLTGNADETLFFDDNFEWFKDKDSIIERTSSRRYVLNEFINRATNVFGRRYSDAKTLKFVIENIQGLFNDDNYNKFFDGFNKYRDELVPELIVDGISYTKRRGKAPVVQVFEEYCAKQNKNICIVAESGMGKSTALRKLFLDKILEDQCEDRYYYYPLRNCSKSNIAKNLWHNIQLIYEYPSCGKRIFLLDAFDETNENDKDLQDDLILSLKSLPENATVMLASRFEVKELRDYKIVTCGKIGLTNCSDDIIRIKNNSDWLERVGIDIFQNPLFIGMAEDIERIKRYIIHDKEAGTKAWKKIEAELIGEYVKSKLKINYAGELIWNYVYLNVLKEWIHSYAFDDIVKLLDSATFIEEYEEYYKIKNYSFYNGENVLNFINNFCKTISDKIFMHGIIVRPKEIENVLNIIDKIFERPIFFNLFFKAKYILTKNYSLLGNFLHEVTIYTKFTSSPDRLLGLFNMGVFCALEMSGAVYNKIETCKGYCVGNIPVFIVKQFSRQIYLGGLRYLEKGDDLVLSPYQQANRYIIYEWLKYGNRTIECKGERFRNLKNLIVNVLLLSDWDISFFNFSNCIIDIRYFGYVQYCKFSRSLIQVLGGQFSNCRFENLKSKSVLSEEVYRTNYVDKVYEVVDEFGNRYTDCGDLIIQIKNYKMLDEKIKHQIKDVLPQAFENCTDDLIMFYDNVERIDFSPFERSARELSSYDISDDSYIHEFEQVKLEHPDRVIIYGNAYIVGLEYISNIEVYNSRRYMYLDGVLYEGNKIIHINHVLPKEVKLFTSFCDLNVQNCHGCEKLILDKHVDMRFIICVLKHNFVDLLDIKNLPKDVYIIFGMLIDFRDDTFCPTILNILSRWYSSYNIIYVPEDFGIYLDWGYFEITRKNKKRIFRPCLYHSNDAVECWEKEYNASIQQSSDSIPWDHTYDNFWHKKFDWGPIILTRDDGDGELYEGLFVEVYDELTEDEKEEVNEQRNQWIEYIKSLPPGKKYR